MAELNTPDARIQRWKRWWDVDDPYVCCTQCGARQLIENADEPFNALHTADCPLRSDLMCRNFKDSYTLREGSRQERYGAIGPGRSEVG